MKEPRVFILTRTDFINKRVYPKEGTRVRIPGTHCICTQCDCARQWGIKGVVGDGSGSGKRCRMARGIKSRGRRTPRAEGWGVGVHTPPEVLGENAKRTRPRASRRSLLVACASVGACSKRSVSSAFQGRARGTNDPSTAPGGRRCPADHRPMTPFSRIQRASGLSAVGRRPVGTSLQFSSSWQLLRRHRSAVHRFRGLRRALEALTAWMLARQQWQQP